MATLQAVGSINESVPVIHPERGLRLVDSRGMEAVVITAMVVILSLWLEAGMLENHLPCM